VANAHDHEADTEASGSRSRRQLIAGAAGALGALAADAVINAPPASAGTDGDVVLGVDGQATSGTTGITSSAAVAFHAKVTQPTTDTLTYAVEVEAPGPNGTGVLVTAGNVGVAATGHNTGVTGTAVGIGVAGVSTVSGGGGVGVQGNCDGTGDGVHGASVSGHGVHGIANASGTVAVFGEHAGGAAGVQGNSTATGGKGVIGLGDRFGVWGLPSSDTGTGVFASTTLKGTGTALAVLGPATFDRSGVVSITFPAKSATVSVNDGLSASSGVLATMQNLISGVYVVAAVPNTGAGTVTITLNKAPGTSTSPKTAKVAWFVVN
jgi:hypothetical protein